MNSYPNAFNIILVGGFLGLIFGIVSERSRFCTMGAIADIVILNNSTRWRAWVWSMIIAIIGMTFLQTMFTFPFDKTFYTSPTFSWLSHLVGGLCFGIGMTLASGCAARNLVRMGSGNLKSLVVLIITAVSAYATMKGLLSLPRLWMEGFRMTFSVRQDIPSLLANFLGISRVSILWICTSMVLMFGSFYCWKSSEFRSPKIAVTATIIGGLVIMGWWVTGVWGYVVEHPDTLEEAFLGTQANRPESFSLLSPLAYQLELFMLWSDKSRVMTFGIATALGIAFGAWFGAWHGKRFRWEGFQQRGDMARHLLGALLMGFGGVCAMGCTIGQGISGVSTLALGSILTTIAIIFGCKITLKWLSKN